MKAEFLPSNGSVFGAAFALLAGALTPLPFAPSRSAAVEPLVVARTRIGFWERLDNWAWRFTQREREAYLAQAQNLADLEDRLRRIDSYGGRFY